jgi:hypothetical protein
MLIDDPTLDDLAQRLAEAAASSPALLAELAEAAELAKSRLAELEAMGLIRVVRAADGTVSAELLPHVLQ